MPAQDLELEYNNRARIPEHAAIFDGWRRDAQAYRNEAEKDGRAELGLPYGTSPRQVVDIFHPQGEPAAGAMAVFIHGGYWQLFEPGLFSHMARGANGRGLSMAIVGYDLCPAVGLGDIVDQVRAACLFLHRRFGRRLVVSGHSAGGHLTACMLATDWRRAGADDPDLVRTGMAISGVFDLAPLMATTINRNLGLDGAEARRLSPLDWPFQSGRIADAVVGEAESHAFRRQSRDFVDAWGGRGAATTYREIPGAHHFDVIGPLADPDSALVHRLVELAGLSQARTNGGKT